MSTQYCHWLIKKTALEMAGEYFEIMASKDDEFYRLAKQEGISQDAWAQKYWPRFVEQARTTLANMLKEPLADVLKDQIARALVADNSLRRGKNRSLVQIN